MKELCKNFVFVSIDKAVNNVAIIYRRLCASTKAKKKKKKGLSSGNSNNKR